MDSIQENIKRLREQFEWSQEELAEKIGKTRSAVSQYESGKIVPRMGVIEDLAALFGVNKSEIIGDTMVHVPGSLTPISSDGAFVDVPLYGSIAAGTPIEMTEIEDFFPIPVQKHNQYPEAYLLKVEGESMNRILPNGSYALIDPCSEVDRDGQPYAVCVNGYDATIKRVKKLNNGFELVPDSTDPTYKPVVYDYGVDGTETITLIGRVVYYMLPFDWDF